MEKCERNKENFTFIRGEREDIVLRKEKAGLYVVEVAPRYLIDLPPD